MENFGEILIDPVSRAFYDDYEDNSLNNQFECPKLCWIEENHTGIDNVILIEGINAHKLLKDTVLKENWKLICSMRSAQIYKFNSTVLIVSDEKELNYFASMADCLDELIKNAKEVSLISLQRLSDYKSDKLPEDCIIKGIHSKFSDIQSLEAPNFITGLSAAISTKRLMQNDLFHCYVAYIDCYDEITIRKILQLLKKIGLSYDENAKIKSLEQSNNLYM